jgi:hypothetical protein
MRSRPLTAGHPAPFGPALPRSVSEEEIRRSAYFLWLDHGCPAGDDQAHWFAAESRLQAQSDRVPTPGKTAVPALEPFLSTGPSAAEHSADPAHRFHAPGMAADHRPLVVAGTARQRMRSRHSGGSLSPAPKKPATHPNSSSTPAPR